MKVLNILIFMWAISPALAYEALMLRMYWNPTSCVGGGCHQPTYKAFTIYEMLLINGTAGNITLWYDCPTDVKDASGLIANEIRPQFDCVYIASALRVGESNTGLWNDTWNSVGSCTGLDPDTYFRTMSNTYDLLNPNEVAAANGVKPPSVDRDTFLSQLSSAWGTRAWIECDKNRNLKHVVVCLDKNDPTKNIDCPYELTDPDDGGHFCGGMLNLPTIAHKMPAIEVPADCVEYTRTGGASSTPVDPNASPSSSSSTNTGAIIGGVIGGLAAVALLVGGIFFYKKKKKNTAAVVDASAMERGFPGGAMALKTSPFDAKEDASPASPATVVGGYGSGVSGQSTSPPSTPMSPSSLSTSLSSRRSTNPLANDQLYQYINYALSTMTTASRGPLSAWELRFSDIKVERPIGEGSWGRVYKGNWQGTDIAVKILLNSETGAENNPTASTLMATNSPIMAQLESESSLMTQLHHPNIVQFLGITLVPAAVVTEFCARGSLTSVLQAGLNAPDTEGRKLSWSRRIAMAADCARGMIYLHSREPPVIHRDLKSANMLVTRHWKVKIADFNLSKILEESTKSNSMQAMNPRWLANEVLNGETATEKSDVFSFAVVMWELLCWRLPWGDINPWGIVSTIMRGERLAIPSPEDLPGQSSGSWPQLPRYLALMQRCWAQEPADRPTFQEIIAELQEIDPVACSY